MRQISIREKIFLSIGTVATLAIFVYFIFWPMLQGDGSGSISSLEELQGRLESVRRLEDMSPALVGLEEQIREQLGYGEMSFKRGIAGSAIFGYLAKAAAQADIKALEQLDPKPYTGRKTETGVASDNAILDSVVDRMYLSQVIDEMERESNQALEKLEQKESEKSLLSPTDAADDNPSDAPPEPDTPEENMKADEQNDSDFDPDQLPPAVLEFLKQRGVSIEELKEDPELREKMRKEFEKEFGNIGDDVPPAFLEFLEERGISIEELKQNSELRERIKKEFEEKMKGTGDNGSSDEPETSEAENPAGSDMPEAPKPDGSDENMEQTKTQKLVFPPIPRDIPSEVKQSLAGLIKTHPGKTIVLSDINWILDDAGVGEEKESNRIRKRLRLYSDSVEERKSELRQWLKSLGILESAKAGQKADKFTVKMVFKSKMDQLVKLLYNLQESAKWLKVESMRISISDRKETLLSVELSMTATALYDL